MDKTMEKVSVIVPVYNGEERLKRCAESILNQDYPELELILVDDGSKDGSYALMRQFAERDPRVKAIHKENGGVSSARNRGLAEASGTYVQFADVDDWLPMDATKLLLREMEQHDAEMVVGDFYRVVDGNVAQKGSIEKGGLLSLRDYADAMLLRPADLYYGVLWNKLYRRGIIEHFQIRMDESISYSEDMLFNLAYLRHVNTVAVLKAPVYYYQYTRGSLVDQSLNLSSTVKMKTTVIGYYNEFFKDTFDAVDYQQRLPVIYSYLVAVSRDSLALPFVPGTRKLGDEAGLPVLSDRELDRLPLRGAWLGVQLMERYLNSLARKHGMENHDMLVLYALERLGTPCTPERLAALTGLGRSAVILILARLFSGGHVRRETSAGPGERFVFHAPALVGEFRQMEQDWDAVRFEGFSEEEILLYRRLEERSNANIRRRISPEG
jgi:Glycosyltransferases involved in cell wall biogenesis